MVPNELRNVTMSIIYIIIIGAIAGFFAGQIKNNQALGTLGNITVGIVGSFIGYGLLRLIFPGTDYGFIGDIIVSTIGAVILLSILSSFNRTA
jgi:uncharacterized membrane protein YeaQ/YmgE (transglycosylase-associated protein family)